MKNPLPYNDTKPTGAADFYFAINATFRFIRATLGADALKAYWNELGREYYAPLSKLWKTGGLVAVAGTEDFHHRFQKVDAVSLPGLWGECGHPTPVALERVEFRRIAHTAG